MYFMMRKKLFLWTAGILLLLGTGCALVIEQVLPYTGIKPYRMEPSAGNWRFPKGILPEDYGVCGTPFTIETSDSVRISGILLASNLDTTKATIIMLHGIGGCKET